MLKEFAVDPDVISSSWETCRYLISQFGVDKGRLISRFPKKWKRMAIEAADDLPDGLKKERVVDYLSSLNSEWLSLVASGRVYGNPEGAWIDNAIAAHQLQPFDAIICNRHEPENGLLAVDLCDETLSEFQAPRSLVVRRVTHDLVRCALPLLQNCKKLRLVDAYFDPTKPRWRDALTAVLAELPNIALVECEYHTLERDNSPSTPELKSRLEKLKECIPAGGNLKVIRWKKRGGGERFHARYLLVENAGLNYEGGLDAVEDEDQTTDVTLLNREVHGKRWSAIEADANVYELAEPVLVVDANGEVTEC